MKKNLNRIAVVPARFGSKRIPKKNIKDFNGKPIIQYILNTASNSGLFDIIHVSTDSDEFSQILSRIGYSPKFMRPSYLADDYTPILDVVKYVLTTYYNQGIAFDYVTCLYPCSPLITSEILIDAAHVFSGLPKSAALISVTEFSAPIQWAYSFGNSNKLIPDKPSAYLARSQDMGPRYYDTGNFSFFNSLDVINDNVSENNFYGYPLSKEFAIDIDDNSDWLLAEAMFSINNRS